jgi:hypothetical protein
MRGWMRMRRWRRLEFGVAEYLCLAAERRRIGRRNYGLIGLLHLEKMPSFGQHGMRRLGVYGRAGSVILVCGRPAWLYHSSPIFFTEPGYLVPSHRELNWYQVDTLGLD